MGLVIVFPGTIIHFVHIPNVAYVQTVPNRLCINGPRFLFPYIFCFPKGLCIYESGADALLVNNRPVLSLYIDSLHICNTPVPEFLDPVVAKTSPKRSFSIIENERFGLVFATTGSIN